MLFNSFNFALFFTLVACAFFLVPHAWRWVLLLAASYYFYACWKPEYLLLIFISTIVAYLTGRGMGRAGSSSKRRLFLVLSLAINLGILCVFKYYNFFNESLGSVFKALRLDYRVPALNVLLPVGISFYTFQTLSYTIDVYRGSRAPERHLGIFALYVSFFPQLVAGPIERSTTLLPQFYRRMSFDSERVASGLKLMLWGFFKKLVIADRLAIYVNQVYNAPGDYQGTPLILATYFFAFQIFCDFSGYSDIAIGAARVMGYDLMTNFNRPYFAQSIREFWQRWHISLSTWFRDYLYIPLGGNRAGGQGRWIFNVYVVFLLSGLWHGANWTFVVWGGLHGLYFLVGGLSGRLRKRVTRSVRLDRVPAIHALLRGLLTFHLVVLSWVFFRADSLSDALLVLRNMAHIDFTRLGINVAMGRYELLLGLVSVLIMEIVHVCRERDLARPFLDTGHVTLRWGVCYVLLFAILMFGEFNQTEFIYFQF